MWEEKENRMTDPRLHLKFQVPKNQKYDTDICKNTNILNKTMCEKHSPPLSPKEKMQYGKRDWMTH